MTNEHPTPERRPTRTPFVVRAGLFGVVMVLSLLGGILLAAGPLERIDLSDPAGLVRRGIGGWLDRSMGTTGFSEPLPLIHSAPGSASPLIEWKGPAPRRFYPRVKLTAGEALEPALHSFPFEGSLYEVTVDVPNEVYWGSREVRHGVNVLPEERNADWHAAEYRYQVFDPTQRPVLDALVGRFREMRTREGWDGDTYLEFMAKYVQTLRYDEEKAATLSKGDGMRFPAETIQERQGVCSDTCVLLAALLAYEGYDVAILTFGPENHTAVGVRVDGPGYRDTGYAFLETTAPSYVGSVPEQLVGGIVLASKPEVARIGTGMLRYGSLADTARIDRVLKGAHPAGSRLVTWAESRPLWPTQVEKVNAHIAETNEAQRRLQYITKDVADAGLHLDRNDAILWIDEHAWWEKRELPEL